MIKVPKIDPIDYLLMRQFKTYDVNYALDRLEFSLLDYGPATVPSAEVLASIRSQFELLTALPEKELNELFRKAREADAIAAEKKLWFNLESAVADSEFWARASFWTLDEGLILLMGRDPRIVTWEKLKKNWSASSFIKRLGDARELALRAVAMKQIAKSNLPGFFLAWAKRIKLDIDPGLEAALEKHGVRIVDWQILYDQQSKLLEKFRESIDEKTQQIESLVRLNELLVAEIEALRSQIGPPKAFGTRERESLLKLVIGMAVAGYSYDPQKPRNDATGDITGDLARLGIPLDQDTVLKWLRRGAEILPPEALEP